MRFVRRSVVTSILYLQAWVNVCSIFYIFRSIWIKLLVWVSHKNSIGRNMGFLKMSIAKVIFYLRTWKFSRTFQIYCQICVEFSLRNQQKIVLVYDLRKFGLGKVVLVLMVVKKNNSKTYHQSNSNLFSQKPLHVSNWIIHHQAKYRPQVQVQCILPAI